MSPTRRNVLGSTNAYRYVCLFMFFTFSTYGYEDGRKEWCHHDFMRVEYVTQRRVIKVHNIYYTFKSYKLKILKKISNSTSKSRYVLWIQILSAFWRVGTSRLILWCILRVEMRFWRKLIVSIIVKCSVKINNKKLIFIHSRVAIMYNPTTAPPPPQPPTTTHLLTFTWLHSFS